MKSIVVFYSRTNNTQFVAETIATNLGSDLQPLVDKKKRKGVWGYIMSGRDSLLQKNTQIEDLNLDLKKYDLIFLGCPNWAANLPPAMRTFLTQFDVKSKKVVLFCTQDGMGAQRVFNALRRLVPGAEIVAEKYFNKVEINKDAVRIQVKNWLTNLNLI